MIIKIASLSQSSIDFIELATTLSFIGAMGKKRIDSAKEYIESIISGPSTTDIDPAALIGADATRLNKFIDGYFVQDKTGIKGTLAKTNYNEAIKELSSSKDKVELLEKIIEYLNIFINKGYTDFLESKSKAEDILAAEKAKNAPVVQVDSPTTQDSEKEGVVTFSEQPQVSPNDEQKEAFNNEHLTHYYVSESSELKGYFAPGTKFFGPFLNKIEAILFSALIHKQNFNDDYSVALGSEVIDILQRRSRTAERPSLSVAAPPESSVAKNEIMKGDFESKAREAGSQISLSTSGESFGLLIDYLINERELNRLGVTSQSFTLGKLISWYRDNGFFNLELLIKERNPGVGETDETDATDSFEEQDISVPDGEGKKTKSISNKKYISNNAGRDSDKIDRYLKLDGLSDVISSVAIVSEEDQNRLSASLLNKCFDEIKASSLSLDSITESMVFDNPDACFIKLKKFFEAVLIKDKELYTQVISFRSIPENRLNIYGVTDEFEFRNHFSIIQKIVSDDVILSRVSRIIGIIRYSNGFGKIKEKINSELKAYLDWNGRKIELDDESKISEYTINILNSIPDKIIYAAKSLIRKALFDIVNNLSNINTDEFLGKVIENISTNAIIKDQVKKITNSTEKILDESVVNVIVCGVCDQEFSIPRLLWPKDHLKKIDAQVKQRTFFRENGELITENELIANNKKYTLSPDAESLLLNLTKSLQKTKTLRRRGGGEEAVKQNVSNSYTWSEANKMTISTNLDEQINGHIIRNDILASLGATEAGKRGAFTNKVLCAGQLYNISENIKQVGTTKTFMSTKNEFRCMGSKPPDSDDYMSSANTLPKKVNVSEETPGTMRYSGFRFSANNAHCPCYLTRQSEQMITWASRNEAKYKAKFIVAVPNIPGDVASQIAAIESGLDIESLYYPPTSPDGTLAAGMQNSAYVVCANKTSISMFDRDPSSENFIQKFFKKILDEGGAKRLSDAVAVLVNYGIEINDIRSHVEAVVVGSSNIEISGSRKSILQSIFKNSKISLAQDMSEGGAQLIKNLGLVCQSGHKFTIEQSWRFAETHSGIFTGTDTATKITRDQINAVLDGNGRDFSALLNIGAIKTTTDEESLRRDGYRQPSELSSLVDIKNYIEVKKLYFKSADDKMYYLSPHTMSGIVKAKPWETGALSDPTRFTRRFRQYSGAEVSTTQDSEGGGKQVVDIPSIISDNADDYSDKYDRTVQFEVDMNFATAIIPDINSNSAKKLVSGFTAQREVDISSKPITFVDNLITTLTVSRVFGSMSADAQIDFLANVSKSAPKNIPNIRELIESELSKIFLNIETEYKITSGDTRPFISEFFYKYDVLGLIERGITSEQFFGLATIADYYDGFAVPPILNLNAEKGRAAVLGSLSAALSKSLTGMIRAHFGKEDLPAPNKNIIEKISELLISPYNDVFSGNGYKSLIKSPIVDYNGRAIAFSFAVDLAYKIKSFFTNYFLNQGSALYIGPVGNADRSSLMIIRDLLDGQMNDGVFVLNLLMLDDVTFNSKIDTLRKTLYDIYKLDNLFQNYMQYKSIEISENIQEAYRQKAVVLERFAKIFDIANNSIDIIKIDLAERRADSPSVKHGAKLLDRTIDVFASRREAALFPDGKPSNVTTLLDVIKKNREELNSGIFETNSIGYAKVNLSDFNDGLDKVAFEALSISRFSIKESLVNKEAVNADLADGSKLSPLGNASISELKVISIGKIVSKIGTNSIEYKICVTTPIKIKTAFGTIESLEDTKKYLKFDGINIINPNQQGIDFISRYTRNVVNDTKRFILLNSNSIEGYGQSVNINDPSLLDMRMSINSSMKVGRIEKTEESDLIWPPRNNLFIDDINIGKDPKDVNAHYDNLLSPQDHSLFMANIENFEMSRTSKSLDTTSSFGILIPFKVGEDNPKAMKKTLSNISQVDNVILSENSSKKKQFLTISDAKIYINTQSFDEDMLENKLLDISWAFRMLDPQVSNEEGFVRHKLIQSTIVKKLDFISSEMIKCYELLKSKSGDSIQRLFEKESPDVNPTESFDKFCNFLFSGCVSWLKISPDLIRGIKEAKLDISEADIDDIKSEFILREKSENIHNMINVLSKFVDYYNASQILNLEYSRLTPSISNADVFNVSMEDNSKSVSLKLLDPFSMWKMVHSKSMLKKFGGPIDSDDVDKYRGFIISTFGIADIAQKVCEKVGFTKGEFSPEDMFDVVGFCNRYSSHPKIKIFKDLFSLQSVVENDEDIIKKYTGDVTAYLNGMPVRGNKNKDLAAILRNAEYSEYSLGDASYIKHLYRTKTLLDNLTAEQRNNPEEVAKYREYIRNLEDGTATMTLKELMSLEGSLSRGSNPSLYKEFTEIMLRLSKKARTASNKNISWRKIAQSVTEDESTIIRSLYHEWWDRYLNVMAEIAAQE